MFRPQLRAHATSAFHALNHSERALLGIVFREKEITQAQVTRLLDLTQPTVSRLVSGLAGKGLIEIGDKEISGRGKPSATIRLKPDYAYAVGISLLGDSVAMCMMDFAGTLVWHAKVSMPGMDRPSVLARLKQFKSEMLCETGLAWNKVYAAGVGVSAFFVGDGGLMNPPALLDEWALVEIAPILAEALQVPVVVDNDGNVACIGENLMGVGRRFRTFAYFQITNGFGGGVIIDGEPYRGVFGNAGEFAALWLAVGMEHPNLEHLRATLKRHGDAYETVEQMLGKFSLTSPGVEAWLDYAAPAYSLVASAASAILDCEAVVLGGRMPTNLATKLAERIEVAGTNRRDRPRPVPVILPAEAPGDAVSMGAAVYALQADFFR